ncbi:hypothetical protein B4903_02055, partial [Yersinia frederiksenii]
VGKFYIKYSVVGRYRVKAEYFNEQGNIINNSDALYVNDILSFISEDYFNDSEILERNVTINTNYILTVMLLAISNVKVNIMNVGN